MKRSDLTGSSVVMTKNGKIGIVVAFNGKPSHIIFASFTNPIDKWDDELNHANDNYSITEVRDGSKVENTLDAFKKRTFSALDVIS